MKASLKLFGATLGQVVQGVERHSPAAAVAHHARVLAVSFALVAAGAAYANGNADADSAPSPSASSPDVSQLVNSASDNVRAAATNSRNAISNAASSGVEVSQDALNKGARIFGGIVGGILGNKVVGSTGALVKAVATLGGAYAGQALGNLAVPSSAQASADTLRGPDGRPLGKVEQQNYDTYRQARQHSFADPAPAGGANALPPTVYYNLSHMMVETAAARLVAGRALRVLEERQLVIATTPGARPDAANVSAERTFKMAMEAFASSHHNTWSALNLAKKNRFDVSNQIRTMEAMPADLRSQPKFALDWPGVEEKAVELGKNAGMTLSYGELHAEAIESVTYVARERQR